MGDTDPLLQQTQREKAWNTIAALYPGASSIDLEAYYDPTTKRLTVKKVGAGKAPYPLFTEERGTKRLRLNPKLSREITFALGPFAEEEIVQQRKEIRETDRRLREATNLEKILNETAVKQQKEALDKRQKKAQLERINTRIENIENEGGTQIEAKKKSKDYEKNYERTTKNCKRRGTLTEKT